MAGWELVGVARGALISLGMFRFSIVEGGLGSDERKNNLAVGQTGHRGLQQHRKDEKNGLISRQKLPGR